MTKKTCMIIGLSLFVLLFVTPLNTSVPQLNHDLSDVRGAPFGFRALPSNATWLAELAEARDIRVHDITQSFKGLTIFCLGIIPNQSTSNNRVGYMIVTNENGEVVNGFYIPEDMPLFPQFINSTTIVHGVKGAQNLSLWNLVTNVSEPLGVRRGNHDVDYNPLTGTFIGLGGHTLTTYEYDGKTYQVKGGDIVEYLRNGTEIGRWDSNSTFPFNATDFHLTNETSKGNIDWMHTNSLYWDVDEDMIYMNVRSRDCIVKVNHATNETVWVLGRYIGEGPGFTLYNKHGVQV
ncbi:MAG: aryl-sulfate sulfotransferase, partial [Promethearchaeota archaeon]